VGGPRRPGILGGLAAAFAVGRRNPRQAEDFFVDLGVGARRALGLGGGNPLPHHPVPPPRGAVPGRPGGDGFAHVKDLIARKVVKNDGLAPMDVMLGEDDAQPCQASRASIETVSWLSIIGYNVVSA